MHNLFLKTLSTLEAAFVTLEGQVEKPQKRPFMDSFVFRYREQSAHQAVVQKLARIVSGLHAARILLEKGFVQELGILQRMLDELKEDVTFICYGILDGKLTELHKRYLAAFYQEEFDNPHDPISSSQNRPMIPRRKIRAYIAKRESPQLDPIRGIKLSKLMSNAYSGFVHGASPHIMDIYGGNPARFHISGMLGTPKVATHESDLWNYFYRGILSFIFTATAFGNEKLAQELSSYCDHFEQQSGTSYGSRAREETSTN